VIEHLAIKAIKRVTLGKSFVNKEVVIVGVAPLKPLLGDHLQLFELIDQTISDTMHKFLDALLENVE
jgi:hypothetical protein